MPRRKKVAEKPKGYWQDKRGRHHWRVEVDGRRYEVSDADPAGAKAKFEALKEKLAAGVDVAAARQTFRELVDRWLETIAPTEVPKLTTVENYRLRLYRFVLPTLGDYPLDIEVLTTEVGQAWLKAALEYHRPETGKPWSRETIAQALALTKRILNRAVEEHLLKYNPFAPIKPPAAAVRIVESDEDELPKGAGQPMNDNQIALFLDAAAKRSHWLESLFYLAITIGLRRGELLGLRWRDYDRERRVLRVRQQVTVLGNRKIITTPKTATSRRTVPIDIMAVELLDFHYERWCEAREKYAANWPADNDFIFCYQATGKPTDPSTLQRHMHQIQEMLTIKYGVEGGFGRYETVDDPQRQHFISTFRFHDLRHTANQRMLNAGVDAAVRAAVLGQASVQVNQLVYTHGTDAAKRDAIERVSLKK